MKLPKSLTTVTRFSKFLALCMLLFFPIVGFYLGTFYQAEQDRISPRTPIQPSIAQQTLTPTPTPKVIEGKMCTMEAKLCPDGSYVGRTGPNCEFARCPTSSITPTPTCIPRPACLDSIPRCMIAESENMCPRSK